MPHRVGCVDGWQRKGKEGWGAGRERRRGGKTERTVAEQEL